MIKRLRIKFIAVTMGVLVLVFLTVFAAINIFMFSDSVRKTNLFLEDVARQDGGAWGGMRNNTVPFLPENSNFPGAEEPARMGSFFYVKTDEDYAIIEMEYGQMYDTTEAEIREKVLQAAEKGAERGSLGNLQYLMQKKSYGYIFVFVEKSFENGMLGSLITVSLWAAGISCVLLGVFVFFLSGWIVRPVQTAFDKQRQFISDASHELKTPLTIISANAEVLENEIGENIRITHMKNQAYRMGVLVKDLLDLAKADEEGGKPQFYAFNLSQVVLGATLEFESRAFEEHKTLTYHVQENVFCTGEETALRQLCTILIDNALRHSDRHGEIHVEFIRGAGQKIRLSVRNTGAQITAEEGKQIFERFYRSDSSRSRATGGYGLGLAIAKAIVNSHNGKIDVGMDQQNRVVFTVLL